MTNRDLADYIQDILNKKNISISKLSRISGISRESIYKILRCDVSEPDCSTLVKLSKPLDTHPSLLVRQLFNGWTTSEPAESGSNEIGDATGFIADVTYPINSRVSTGKRFTKTWRIQNTGTTTWKNRSLVCQDEQLSINIENHPLAEKYRLRGLKPVEDKIPIPTTEPGDSVDISVELEAPMYPGTMISYWIMVDEQGKFSFPEHDGLSCQVQIVSI